MTMLLICSTFVGAAEALDQQRSALPCADVAAADVAVVLLDGLDDLVERQAVLDQPVRDRCGPGTASRSRPNC